MLWNAYLYDRRGKVERALGRVRAKNSPAAILAACRKFKIPAAQQRYVGARSVKPLPTPEPLPEETVRELRAFTRAFNAAIRKAKPLTTR